MFQYESKTIFSRTPEFLKLAVMLALSISAVFVYNINFQIVVFALSAVLLIASGFREFRKLFSVLIPILLFANFGILLFFSNLEADVSARMLIISLRLCTMVLSFAFFLRATNLFRLVGWLRRIGMPETLHLALYVVLRFLPEVEREFHEIRAAQKMRAAVSSGGYGYGTSLALGTGFARFARNLRRFNPISGAVALLLPLLYSVFERSDELTIAYELRKRRQNF